MENWLIYALIGFFAFGILNFVVKFISGKVPLQIIILIFSATVLILGIAVFVQNPVPMQISRNILILAAIAGLLYFVGFYAVLRAFNLGLGSRVVTIFNMNTLVTVALFILVLGEKLNYKISLGVILAVASLYLLAS